jgi:hypothetical protein
MFGKPVGIFGVCFLLAGTAFAYEEVPASVYEAGKDSGEEAVTPAPTPAPEAGKGSVSGAEPATVENAATATAASLNADSKAGQPKSSAVAVSAQAEVDLDEVTVAGRSANLIGKADSGSSGSVSQEDLSHRALLRPAEVLEAVPGLLITQHSGDGKANQYFTRGFNLDHGTDFAFFVDGVPVNEPTNAHGQGYADLNFMIPELAESVDYHKGPFNIEAGDFATAGSANFVYPTKLKYSVAELTMGEFGFQRALAASQLSLLGGNLIFALEEGNYDGPWDVPENNKKFNGLLRYTRGNASNRWTLSASAYEANWDATNQMPADAIADGFMSEFGNLNPSDGGERDRDFVWASWTGKTGDTETDVLAYAGYSHLKLWNDFTFYLPYEASGPDLDEGMAQSQFANPNATNGEQFLEQDDRTREGGTVKYKFEEPVAGFKTKNEAGFDVRNDNLMVGLYNTDERVSYETVSLNHVVETESAPYFQNTTQWTSWLKSEVGFREDFFAISVANETPAIQDGYDVLDATAPTGPNGELAPLSGFNQGAGVGTDTTYHSSMPEPKAALIVHPEGSPYELYLNFGQGFHSNDVRELAQGLDPLTRAQSEEIGARYAKGSHYETTLALWRMDMASELTFDGDSAESVTNAASTRQGLEWSNTFRAKPYFVDLDLSLSQARFLSEDTLDDPSHPGYYVPEAVEQVGTATFGIDKVWGWSFDARVRYFGSRALTADNEIRSTPTTLVSLQVIRDLVKGQTLNFDVFNLLNQNYYDVSYYYAYAYPGVDSGQAHEAVMAHATEPISLRVSWVDHF